MLLTLNQVLFIILTVAAVVAVAYLVMFLSQLRRTAREGERTLIKAQEALDGIKELEAKLNANLDQVGEIVAHSRKAVAGISDLSLFLTTRILKPSVRFWPLLIPLIRYGWQLAKKRKEKKNGK